MKAFERQREDDIKKFADYRDNEMKKLKKEKWIFDQHRWGIDYAKSVTQNSSF